VSGSSGGWDNHYDKHRRPWAGAVHGPPLPEMGGRVLEAGCGNGKFLEELLKEDNSITAFDFSEKAVKSCRNIAGSHKDGREPGLMTADCRTLPFRDFVFDSACYRHVTGHMVYEDRKILAFEAGRVLKENGTLFFTGFSTEDMRAGKGKEIEKNTFLKGNGIMTHYFTENEVRELFSRLKEVSLKTVRWNMRIRGKDYTRAEIAAIFQKISR